MSFAAVKVGDSLQNGLDGFFGFLPNLLGFLVILFVGFLIAKVVKGLLSKVLQKAGLDRALHSGATGKYVEQVSPGASPSKLIGAIAFWFIFLFALTAAIGALKIPAVTAFMNTVMAYLPNVIAAVLIFVVAGAIAGAVGGLVAKTMGDTPTGKIVSTVVPGLIMAIAAFMVLSQLNIAQEIVTITYVALIGSLALAAALAFGLGGRDVAAELLRSAYDSGQRNKEDVKRDMEHGKAKAKQEANGRFSDPQTQTAATAAQPPHGANS